MVCSNMFEMIDGDWFFFDLFVMVGWFVRVVVNVF